MNVWYGYNWSRKMEISLKAEVGVAASGIVIYWSNGFGIGIGVNVNEIETYYFIE